MQFAKVGMRSLDRVRGGAITISLLLVAGGCASTQPSPSISASVAPAIGTSVAAESSAAPTPLASSAIPLDPAADDPFAGHGAPIDLHPTLASTGAVSTVIDQAGGQITASGPDGTTYTLDIPAEDLFFPTTITMTPLADFTGLPFATQPTHRLGVEFEPQGLELVSPATLTITPKAPLPAAGVATFAYEGDGTGAGLVVHAQTDSTVKLSVEHFSGWTATWPLENEDWRQAADARQADIEASLAAWIAAMLGKTRQEQLAGQPSESLEEILANVSPLVFEKVLAPRLRMALSDCTEAKAAARAWLGWSRQLQLLGVSDDEYKAWHGEMPDELRDDLWQQCLEKEARRCYQTGDLPHLMAFLLGFARQAELMGTELTAEQDAAGQKFLTTCGRYHLIVTSQQDGTGTNGVETTKAEREMDLQWQPGGGIFGILGSSIQGESDVTVLELERHWTLHPEGCPHYDDAQTYTNIQTDHKATAKIVGLAFTEGSVRLGPTGTAQEVPPILIKMKLQLELGQIGFVNHFPTCPDIDVHFRLYDDFSIVRSALAAAGDKSSSTDPDATAGGITIDRWDFVSQGGQFNVNVTKHGEQPDTSIKGKDVVSLEVVLDHNPS